MFSKQTTRPRQCNLGYATRWSTDASHEAIVDNEWLSNIGYAIYALQFRLCNLGYAVRLSTDVSREASGGKERLCILGNAIHAVRSMLCNVGYAMLAMQCTQAQTPAPHILWRRPACTYQGQCEAEVYSLNFLTEAKGSHLVK